MWLLVASRYGLTDQETHTNSLADAHELLLVGLLAAVHKLGTLLDELARDLLSLLVECS